MPSARARRGKRGPSTPLAVDRERVIEELLARAPIGNNVDRRRDSDIQAFIDVLVTRTLTHYHYSLLREAYEEGYQRGLSDGRHAIATLRELTTLRKELDGRAEAASSVRRAQRRS